MNRRAAGLLIVLSLCLLAPGRGPLAFELSEQERLQLDRPESRFKVSAAMADQIKMLLLPLELDGRLPGGFVLETIEIDRFHVRVEARREGRSFSLYLLPPLLDREVQIATPSFKLLFEGEVDDLAAAALAAAVVRNDDGTFWPEVAPGSSHAAVAAQSGEQSRIPPGVLGDLLLLALLVAFVVGLPELAALFAARPLSWWWLLLAVAVGSLGLRLIPYFGQDFAHLQVVTISDEILPHSSIAWMLNGPGRLGTVSLETVATINLLLGAATPALLFRLTSLLFPGLTPSLLAALFAATSPAHIACSSLATAAVPFLFLASFAALALTGCRGGRVRVAWLAAALYLFAIFSRPEALLLLLPLLALPLVGPEPFPWRRPALLLPVAVIVLAIFWRIVSLVSGPASADPFLHEGLSVSALFSNAGTWLVSFSRVSFAAMLLWALAVAGRAWRGRAGAAAVILAMLLLAWFSYFRIELPDASVGGRASLFFLLPASWLAAAGAAVLADIDYRRRRWLVALLIVWLLLTPWIHFGAIRQDFPATFGGNFLTDL